MRWNSSSTFQCCFYAVIIYVFVILCNARQIKIYETIIVIVNDYTINQVINNDFLIILIVHIERQDFFDKRDNDFLCYLAPSL